MLASSDVRGWLIENDSDILAAQTELVTDRLLAPLAFGGQEERVWLDCDLASLAENRLGYAADPGTLDDERRADLIARATTEPLVPPSARESDACYWLLDRGERVGTIAVAKSAIGGPLIRVSSLYVFAAHRGRGTARRALGRLRDALERRGFGVRLETSWTWQQTFGTVPAGCTVNPQNQSTTLSTTGALAKRATAMLAMSRSIRLGSAGFPAPSIRTRSASAASPA